MNREALIEMVKEAGRIAFFAALTAVVAWAGQKVGALDPNSVFYIVGTLVLRLVDKYIHENQDIKAQGVAPF